MPRETSAGAVIFRREATVKFLLLQYGAGHWDFAKGNVEEGEDVKETVTREIKEETGIEDAVFVEGFEDKISYFYKREKNTVYKEVTFYLAETKAEKVTLSHEHVGYEWLDFQDAIGRLTYKNAKETLRKSWNFLSSHS